MTTLKHCAIALAMMLFSLVSAGAAQTASTTPEKHEPCWEQVGVSKSALEQRKQIAQNLHSQVEEVRNNSSLTQQQKEQQIHQMHEQAHTRMNALVSPEKMKALKSCREQRKDQK
jgi:hypothetical protein